MRMLVLGAGGIGGYFGGRLIEAGADVTFLVRARRAAQLAADGLVVESPLGDIRRGVNAVTTVDGEPPYDIILLACKAHGLAGALEAVSPCIGPESAILPLLNGIGHFDAIERRFPAAAIWRGLAHIGVTLMADGTIRHLNSLHRLAFGFRPGDTARASDTGKAERFRDLLVAAGTDAVYSGLIDQELWEKFVFLSALAAATCLMRADIGTIVGTPGGKEFMRGLLDETAAVATACGYAPRPAQLESYRRQLSERGSASKASMLRDIENGAPTEAEHILGDMAARAARHSVPVPVLELALRHLRAYEDLRQRTALQFRPQ